MSASWDWGTFAVRGRIAVRPLGELTKARPVPASQDMLVARAGKVPITLEGADFEFVSKVEIERQRDKFAVPAPVPFILPHGVRQGPQETVDVQINTGDLDPSDYILRFTQLDGKTQSASLKILAAPPVVSNLPGVHCLRGRHQPGRDVVRIHSQGRTPGPSDEAGIGESYVEARLGRTGLE